MKTHSRLASFLIAIFVSSCASVSPSALHSPATKTSLTLAENFVYTREKLGIVSRDDWSFLIAKGHYVSTVEDANGTYYRSQGNELVERRDRHESGSVKSFARVHDGGIYLPKDSALPAMVFVIAGSMRELQLQAPGSSPTEKNTVILLPVPTTSPGVAAGVGVLVTAVFAAGMAAERGNYAFYHEWAQPEGTQLRRALGQ